MRLFVFFCSFLLSSFSFAYDIEPYGKQASKLQNSLNLVFCPLHYQDTGVFLKDIDALITKLSKTSPFDELVRDTGFYYLVLSKEEENLIFKEAQGLPPLKVRRDFLDDISARVKSGYKLIIVDAKGAVSTAELSSLDKVSLIILGRARYKDSNSFAKGFLHELGHSLGLRDEGSNSEAALCLPGAPNCAATLEEAKDWWGDLAGKVSRVHYVNGCCGNKNFIRPTIASLMNDPDKAEDFGPVNERYLRQVFSK